MDSEWLLEIKDMTITDRCKIPIVSDIDLRLKSGESVGLIGESGSGKSTTALAAGGLLHPGCSIANGNITLDGRSIENLNNKSYENIRGRIVSFIFQEPMTALNPTMKIGCQLTDVLRHHFQFGRQAARARAAAALDSVSINNSEAVLNQYPFELSGGMRQRVLIAMAFACKPKLVIADEPTTALDTTIQRQILEMLTSLVRESNAASLIITHDCSVVRHTCDRVYVMKNGKIVESGLVSKVLDSPEHPYTASLLAALPENATPQSYFFKPPDEQEAQKPQ